jgi:hypothetical protein
MLAFHQPNAPAGFSEGDRQCRSRLAGADDQKVKVRGNPSVNLRLLLIASGFRCGGRPDSSKLLRTSLQTRKSGSNLAAADLQVRDRSYIRTTASRWY